MKEIKAVIRPTKLPALREALRSLPGFPGMTISKVEGLSAPERIGPCKGSTRHALTDYTAKVRIEIVSPDELTDTIVERIVAAASTGQIGDGLVWITPIDRVLFVHKCK